MKNKFSAAEMEIGIAKKRSDIIENEFGEQGTPEVLVAKVKSFFNNLIK